jgi:hypothetical protein
MIRLFTIRMLYTAILAASSLGAISLTPAQAQEASPSGGGAPCEDFSRTASSTVKPPQAAPDLNFEAKFKKQTEAGQKGLECAKYLTERFKSMRTSSDPEMAEKVLDEYAEVYKKLLNGIEGNGMLLEEANLFLSVLASRVKEAESRSPEAVKEEEARQQRLMDQITTIGKYKADLDKQLVDIITKKKDISFYVRGKQIDEAIDIFKKFNDGLSNSINEMNKTLQMPAQGQTTGSF